MTCPTPAKVAYETQAQALKALDASLAVGAPMRAYPCPCGAYHLTKRGVPALKTCEYGPCDRTFPDDGQRRYCCRSHSTKANAKRRAERDRALLAATRERQDELRRANFQGVG